MLMWSMRPIWPNGVRWFVVGIVLPPSGDGGWDIVSDNVDWGVDDVVERYDNITSVVGATRWANGPTTVIAVP
jgi:hypothetical protein